MLRTAGAVLDRLGVDVASSVRRRTTVGIVRKSGALVRIPLGNSIHLLYIRRIYIEEKRHDR
jgi:hypothetical protein